MQRLVVSVLGVLDNEDEPERNDGGSGIDYQLPGITVVEDGSRDEPHQDQGYG